MKHSARTIIGAIAGDVIGSVYEWHNVKTTDFNLARAGKTKEEINEQINRRSEPVCSPNTESKRMPPNAREK